MARTSDQDRQAKIQAATPRSRSPLKIILAVAVVAAVALGVTLTLVLTRDDTPDQLVAPTTGTAQIALPRSVTGAESPIIATHDGTLNDGIPTLQVFEDYQCPVCKQAEDNFGSTIRELGSNGKINVTYYVMTFLDRMLKNDSSMKAAGAAGCAADAGRFEAFHEKTMARQPAHEGDGYTDEQLISAATDAGISGAALDTWKTCFTAKKYHPYFRSLDTYAFDKAQLKGTPTYYLNGKQLDVSPAMSAGDFAKLIEDASRTSK
ncbi:hypothetical protein KEM60_01768 [Austwickia sp. TVS 96-490-7B]|uniref:DsbA family protein n=1 Tax=Austwickia sp. TVS 96-490-7B TaxID=2830843 RepID=UPI001C55AE69|nr:thioredoxin domain-containing protein [Austwickia sp. TVS 96-490-7B]MBW3085568.1 hypothetical protein [Austwickia sp. TVS 96-490-7B]